MVLVINNQLVINNDKSLFLGCSFYRFVGLL